MVDQERGHRRRENPANLEFDLISACVLAEEELGEKRGEGR